MVKLGAIGDFSDAIEPKSIEEITDPQSLYKVVLSLYENVKESVKSIKGFSDLEFDNAGTIGLDCRDYFAYITLDEFMFFNNYFENAHH